MGGTFAACSSFKITGNGSSGIARNESLVIQANAQLGLKTPSENGFPSLFIAWLA
jgi:hypothetical protein